MIIAGGGPVEGGDVEVAATNVSVFAEQVREQAVREGETRGYAPSVGPPMRDGDADREGRFGWILPVNGTDVRVLMPGVELQRLRAKDAAAPCVIVNGEIAWWAGAVQLAVPLPRRG